MIFKLIRPKSLINPEYEDFEYLIRWIGRDGSEYLKLFEDAEFEHEIESSLINTETTPEALISRIGRSVSLKADDLSLNDVKIIGQLFENKFVTRLKKDGTYERYAPDATTFRYRIMDGRYELEFKLILSDVAKCR
jgi:hypothetical protein